MIQHKAGKNKHTIETTMKLPKPLGEVFPFFADAANLEKITPPELRFRICSSQPVRMFEGTTILYQLRLWGIPFVWKAKISLWKPPHLFVDEQLNGPYASWIHTHRFWEEQGETIISDRVVYTLPFWPVGELAFPLVHAHVKRIFRYRRDAIRKALLG